MASSKWKTFQELEGILAVKKLVFWGATNWIERTLENIQGTPEFIVDKSKLNQDIKYNGCEVFSPDRLKEENQVYVVITTANYISVIEDLEKIGYIMGDDFCCTPLLNLRKSKDDLLSHSQTLLISSPDHYSDKDSGGGLYKVKMNPYSIEKVYTGKTRGVSISNHLYYVVDMLKGLVVLDYQFNEIDIIELEKNSEPHGIFVDNENKLIYVGSSGRDSVTVYSVQTKKKVNEYFISNKWKRNKKDNHHVNDPYVYGDSLYVSLFSFSGNWMNEVYDGGVLEIDLVDGKVLGPVITDKWMPHSVMRVDGKLTILDSMLGELYHGSYAMACKINGFARGLCYDGKYFYIGATEHRYPEKLVNISTNISLDTGFYVFDSNSSMTKFFSMPNIQSIHSILSLEEKNNNMN